MGCAPSKPVEEDDEKLKELTAKQRRRLSVAPEKVGDTSKDTKPSEAEQEVGSPVVNETKKAKVAHFSKKGFVPYNKNKVNQDRLVVKTELGDDPNVSLYAVMDGHGEFGHLVAEFVKTNLPKQLAAFPDLRDDPPKYMTLAVKKVCSTLSETGINLSFSGTTLIFVVKIDDMLYIGNVGDSRCVLGYKRNDNELSAMALSTDHKPDLPSEKARILQAGGRVCPLPGPEDEDCGPERVWLEKADVPGLAMSRSIGDEVSQQVGVISIPEILTRKISESDQFIILATDGVWEFVSNDDAVKTVAQHLDNIPEGVKSLINLSHSKWSEYDEVIDDITCVIVQFEHS